MRFRSSNSDRCSPRMWSGMVLGCVLCVVVSGCDKAEVHSYRVSRERDFDKPVMRPSGQTRSAALDVSWTVPESWSEIPTTVSMRIATFETGTGLEIAVSSFPGDVGGLVANVNRWSGMVGLEPTDEAGLVELIEILDDGRVIIVDVTGEGSRLVGSVIDVGDGKTWFAKVIGDADAVGEIKNELIEFSRSFLHHAHDDGHDHGDGEGRAASESSWTIPREWTADSSLSSMMIAGFTTESGARITLTSLAGDGGGMLSNVNRWRGQLGLPIVESMSELVVTNLDDGALIVDLISEDRSKRIVAGLMPIDGQTLFFKMTGTGSETDPEFGRFEEFIRAVGAERPGG